MEAVVLNDHLDKMIAAVTPDDPDAVAPPAGHSMV
jgi:hypothetical protein